MAQMAVLAPPPELAPPPAPREADRTDDADTPDRKGCHYSMDLEVSLCGLRVDPGVSVRPDDKRYGDPCMCGKRRCPACKAAWS